MFQWCKGRSGQGWFCSFLCLFLWLCSGGNALAEQTLVVPGTGDSQALLRVLAKAFEAENPAVRVAIPKSVGSIGGIKRVLSGETPIGRVARGLTAQEQAHGLNITTFAYSPVVFVTSANTSCLDNITSRQVVDIYSGKTGFWSQLGACEKKKIYVANREEGDSSRNVLNVTIPGFKEIQMIAGEVLYSTQENVRIVKGYPGTIGYAPLSSVVNEPLRILTFEKVYPDRESIQQGKYPLAVPFSIVWKDDLEGVAKAFVEFLYSEKAVSIIEKNGAVPVSSMDRRPIAPSHLLL